MVAGLALGLLFFKPQFGLALAVVVLAGGEWAMLAGLAVAAAAHVGIVAATTGVSSLVDYVAFMREVTAVEYLIEPDPFELHSIRSLARLAPDWLATPLWLLGSAVVLERTVRVWRSGADVLVRLGVLLLATVLVSPHLFVYDAAVLSLALLWIGGVGAADPRDDAAGRRTDSGGASRCSTRRFCFRSRTSSRCRCRCS